MKFAGDDVIAHEDVLLRLVALYAFREQITFIQDWVWFKHFDVG